MFKRNQTLLMIPMLIVLCAVSITGCREGPWPVGPGPFRQIPTIRNIWPNDDGMTWIYDYTLRVWQSPGPYILYDTVEEVPPIPSFEEIEMLLVSHPGCESAIEYEVIYQLQFDGTVTTHSGVTAQNLTETVIAPGTGRALAEGMSPAAVFLARLLVARPDLKERIVPHLAPYAGSSPALAGVVASSECFSPERAFAAIGDAQANGISKPMLIHGYAWEKTSHWIGTYGDLDQLLAWKFLESNLRPGHEFTHQLVPSIADDVFLRCRVMHRSELRPERGRYKNAVRCIYTVDYGIAGDHGMGGETKYFRLFDYGMVTYVPYRGPVFCYERNLVQPISLATHGGDKTLALVRVYRSE